MFSLEIFSDARGNLWSIYKIQALNTLLMFVCFFSNDFPETCMFFPSYILLLLSPLSLWMEKLGMVSKIPLGLHFLLGFVCSPPHRPNSSKIHFGVWDFPFIPIKTKPVKFPPPNRVPVLKRQQPPALVLSGMKRGHRSCKAAQMCEMGFTRCSATSGVAMYDSVCAQSRKGTAFKATPAITSYIP